MASRRRRRLLLSVVAGLAGAGALAAVRTAAAAGCGDGTCDDGETTADCPGDCPDVCQRIPGDAVGEVVDDSSACFTAGGDPQYIRTASAGTGGSLKWTYCTSEAEVANFGVWELRFAVAGTYRVEVHTPAPWAASQQATYQVAHAGTTDPVPLNQAAADGWQVLGDFAFSADGDQSIRVDDNTGEASSLQRQLAFDSIRFTRIDREPGEDGGEDDGGGGPSPSGCATAADGRAGAGGAPLLGGLALLAAVGRRRRRTASGPAPRSRLGPLASPPVGLART